MRLTVAILLLLLAAPAAGAWTDPVPLTPERIADPQIAAAPDGTVVTAWRTTAGELAVRIAAAAPVVLDTGGGIPQLAAGDNGQAVVVWDGGAGFSTAVLFGPGGQQLGPPEVVAPGVPYRVAMNAAGDVSLAGFDRDATASHVYLTFRPAGGRFGAPVSPGALPSYTGAVEAFALSPAGETLLGVTDGAAVHLSETGLDVYARDRDGALSGPVHLDDEARFDGSNPSGDGAAFAFDDAGRALAAYSRFFGLETAVRAPDGTWSAATLVPETNGIIPTNITADVDAAGDAVVALRDRVIFGHPSSSGPGTPYVATGSLAGGPFSPVTALAPPGAYGYGLDVASAADGSTVVAWGEQASHTVRAVTRSQTGAFGSPELAACSGPAPHRGQFDSYGQPAPFAAPGLLLVHDGLAADLPGAPTPCDAHARLRVSPRPARAGRPVTLDARSLLNRDYDLESALFRFPHGYASGGLRITHTFAHPGRTEVIVRVTETSRLDGEERYRRAKFTVRVVP